VSKIRNKAGFFSLIAGQAAANSAGFFGVAVETETPWSKPSFSHHKKVVAI